LSSKDHHTADQEAGSICFNWSWESTSSPFQAGVIPKASFNYVLEPTKVRARNLVAVHPKFQEFYPPGRISNAFGGGGGNPFFSQTPRMREGKSMRLHCIAGKRLAKIW
jgi:hypothetical protein